jgi:S-adenosylmethionine:tRNA ribosyltransferase-isomerase
MQLKDFEFPFDPNLIAKSPSRPRDQARLLVVPRGGGSLSDHRIIDLPDLLKPGDVVVVNDTKVLPVRLVGIKQPGGGKVEVVLVKAREDHQWEVFIKGRVKVGQRITLSEDAQATVVDRSRERTVIKVNLQGAWGSWLDRVGQMPLPPYIKREPTEEDREDYQTMFAKVKGAIAAPTAGLHFTSRLLEALKERGIRLATLTLHVGPGTFRPVTTVTIEEHRMDPEWYRIPQETAEVIRQVRETGGRVVAVGTTVARSLEAAASSSGEVLSTQDETNLFITPGFQFRVVDILLTNFHLPGTTLLMLIAAFAGLEQSRSAYEHAVKNRYRFYSYGDAMLIQ